MKKQKNTDQYLALPLSLMTPKYNKDLHYNLFSIEDTLEYKLFLAILAKSTMIYKNTNLEKIQTFSMSGMLGRNSYLPTAKLTFEKIENFVNNLNSLFFDELIFNNKSNTISFKLSDEYKSAIMSRSFRKIDLRDLKRHKNVKSVKLDILTKMNNKKTDEKSYFNYYYLTNVLCIDNKKTSRKETIRQIKTAFKNIGITPEYRHPRTFNSERREDDYRFYFNNFSDQVEEEKVEKQIKKEEVNILVDNAFDLDNFNIKDFDVEEEKTISTIEDFNEEIKKPLNKNDFLFSDSYLNYI